ncbi:MAG: phosphonate C-P lyase system protein PhnG [Planctomycetota bacterium]
MAIFARATIVELQAGLEAADCSTNCHDIRAPETGLVMARGRISGTGQPFNLGEVTVTRAVVEVAGGSSSSSSRRRTARTARVTKGSSRAASSKTGFHAPCAALVPYISIHPTAKDIEGTATGRKQVSSRMRSTQGRPRPASVASSASRTAINAPDTPRRTEVHAERSTLWCFTPRCNPSRSDDGLERGSTGSPGGRCVRCETVEPKCLPAAVSACPRSGQSTEMITTSVSSPSATHRPRRASGSGRGGSKSPPIVATPRRRSIQSTSAKPISASIVTGMPIAAARPASKSFIHAPKTALA